MGFGGRYSSEGENEEPQCLNTTESTFKEQPHALSPILTKLVRHLSKTIRKSKNDAFEFERQETPESAKLLLVLEDKNLRNQLINMLMAGQSDATVKLRFCIAVNEYSTATEKAERQAKGRKIVALFIQTGSFFCLTGVPYSTHVALVHGKESAYAKSLNDLKALFVDELARTRDVICALQRLVVVD
ncbi:hypothetical protein BASA81_002791 [Batrachochytrium salamandrivorans]|nr:hypothetical protein BASA81_002791 [Batrachochytrium salamandrivorans]